MGREKEQVPYIDQAQGVIVGDHGRQVNNWFIPFFGEDAPLGKRKRQVLLKRVKAYVEEEIKSSFYSEVLRELKLSNLSEEVTHPWRFTFHLSLHDEYELPRGTSIKDVYDQTQGSLLILGEGGGGKTTLLFQLALDLLHRAEQDENEPIPIVLNLSSWAKKQPLEQWLAEAMRKPYQISPNITRKLIKQDLLIPLLDGFNEVTETERSACARAIRDYQEKHSLTPLVICSRNDQDLKQEKHDFIRATASIHPLILQQVDAFISSVDSEKTWLKDVFSKDRLLYELATTPLMLCMITLAYYHGATSISWARETLDIRRQRLLALYVERMLKRENIPHTYSPEDTKRWLTQLALEMIKNNEPVFYIEYMQTHTFLDTIPDLIELGFLEGTIAGIIGGTGFVEVVYRILEVYHLKIPLPSDFLPYLLEIIDHTPRFAYFIIFALSLLFVQEFIGAVRSTTIIPLKTVWFWQIGQYTDRAHATETAFVIFVSLLVSGISVLLYGGLPSTVPELATGLLLVVAFLLYNVRMRLPLRKNTLLKPNQGIGESMGQGICYGLGSGLFFGLLTGLAFWQAEGQSLGISIGFYVGLLVLWLVGMHYGGRVCLQHCILRLALWQRRLFPLNLARFFHSADTRLLLHPVGGGYSFIHPLLQDYFVTLGTALPLDGEVRNEHDSPRTSQSIRRKSFFSRKHKRRKKSSLSARHRKKS